MFRGILLAGVTFGFISSGALASPRYQELDGFYVPIRGWAETREISQSELGESPTQIGNYEIVLQRNGWFQLTGEAKRRIKHRLVLKGVMKGVLDQGTFTLDHVFVPEDRDGALYSAEDVFIPEAGDPYCSQGIPLSGTEFVNLISGTGKYQNLTAGTIHVRGTINNCPGNPGFLNNDFEVIEGVGGVCFGDCVLPEQS